MSLANQTLSREDIINLLRKLAEDLGRKSISGEVYLVGGAVMVLAFSSRESTRDIDGIFKPTEEFRGSILRLASELDLDQSWLNDAVKGYLSEKADFVEDGMPQFENLVVKRGSDDFIFAMKALSARMADYGQEKSNDLKDLEFLVERLKVRSLESGMKIIEKYYAPHLIRPNTRFFLEEAIRNVFGLVE